MSNNSEAVARFRVKRRLRVQEYLGGQCAQCGSKEDLEADHIDPTTKEFNIAEGLQRAWSRLVVELDKCQLLCRPCHWKKSGDEGRGREPWNKGQWQHGSLTAYCAKKCRCAECRTFYSAYKKALRKSRKGTQEDQGGRLLVG